MKFRILNYVLGNELIIYLYILAQSVKIVQKNLLSFWFKIKQVGVDFICYKYIIIKAYDCLFINNRISCILAQKISSSRKILYFDLTLVVKYAWQYKRRHGRGYVHLFSEGIFNKLGFGAQSQNIFEPGLGTCEFYQSSPTCALYPYNLLGEQITPLGRSVRIDK